MRTQLIVSRVWIGEFQFRFWLSAHREGGGDE